MQNELVIPAMLCQFKAVVKQKDGFVLPQAEQLSLHALSHGVAINPNVFAGRSEVEARYIVDSAIKLYGVNANKVNSTFYKRFSDVESRSELHLRLEQLLHYASTYGQGYPEDTPGWEPEYLKDVDMEVLGSLTVIDTIEPSKLESKIKNTLTGGIALSEETQHDLLTIIRGLNINLDYIDKISNREFMCVLCKRLNLMPVNFDEFTRYLVYLLTNNTLLIKSKQTYAQVDYSEADYSRVEDTFEGYVKKFGIEKVAENITRYRKLYLIMRKHFSDKKTINKALKLSKKLYRPRKQSALEHVNDSSVTVEEVQKAAKNATVFKLIKVWNALKRYNTDQEANYYKIRNGKSYLKLNNSYHKQKPTNRYRKTVVIINELRDRLGNWNDRTFYIPKGVEYAVPTSGKDFIGSLPYMSSYTIKGAISLGIAWDKPADLDLHSFTLDGRHFGWNSSYLDDGITYSGDMTHPNQFGYAAEFYRLKPGAVTDPLVLEVSDFASRGKVPFDVFVTNASIDKESKQGVATQITKDSFLFHDEVDKRGDSKALMVVFPTSDGFKVALISANYGNVQVPGESNAMPLLIDAIKHQLYGTVTMDSLVNILGGYVTDNKDTFNQMKEAPTGLLQYVPVPGWGKPEKQTYFDLTPSVATQSTFIDLLKEPEEEL